MTHVIGFTHFVHHLGGCRCGSRLFLLLQTRDELMKIDEMQTTCLIKRNLNLDDNLAKWFFNKCFSRTVESVRCNADACVSDTGEVDIRAEFRLDEGTTAILFIENKIDAQPTHRQFERYRERVERERAKGRFDLAAACLVAPCSYIKNHEHADEFFDATIDYESLRTVVQNPDEKKLIAEAITKGTTAIPPDVERTKWKDQYFTIVQAVWPGAEKASASTQPLGDLMTYKLSKPPPLKLYEFNIEHHVWDKRDKDVHNTIRIKFNFRDDDADSWEKVLTMVRENLPSDMRMDRGKSKSLRIYVYTSKDVPHVDITRPANEQAEAIRTCGDLAHGLYEWVTSLPGF
jgi:hypothetical protein